MINLIPIPKYYKERFGEFILNSDTTVYADEQLNFARDFLVSLTERTCGYKPHIVVSKKANVCFLYDRSIAKEGYIIDCTTNELKISASSIAGAFYAVQSLRQLMLAEILEKPGVLNMHAIYIEDEPRYEYRGILLDEARYFFGMDVVKGILDMMAFHKLNVLHWHLTDNEGWRIEIKKYPKLTEIGSSRRGTQHIAWGNKSVDWTPQGGFYTQKEIKEIVAYAARLNIMIVPEIDMPAHFAAAIASYPELSCRNVKIETAYMHGNCEGGHQNIIACAGKDTTYQFIYDVIDELAPLFPAPYFHIGGDEAPKTEWKKCPDCQRVMQENGLKNEEELQGYMNNKIAVYLKRKGKRLIGWNEILKTTKDLEHSVVVQYWTPANDSRVANALVEGRSVIISKHQAFYLDMTYAQNSLKTTYEFEPEKIGLTGDNSGILGVEGTFWSEWIPTKERLEFQMYPRLEAFAETAWSPRENKNYKDFYARLVKFMPTLRRMNIVSCPLHMTNVKNKLKAFHMKNVFVTKNAHAEYNRAMLYRKRHRK